MTDTEIDLYADVVENEHQIETGDNYDIHSEQILHEGDLNDDVITTQSVQSDFTDITNTVHQTGTNENAMNSFGGKRISLYVGQLTWWTTDIDLAEAIAELGIKDLLEIKFHENRVNGQSKGFAVVTVGSEGSSRTVLAKLPKREIYGQIPHILPCNKQSLSFFEGITRKDEPSPPMNAPIQYPVMRPPMSIPRTAPIDGSYRFPHQGALLLAGRPTIMTRPPMQNAFPLRGPMILNRMSGSSTQQSLMMMQQTQRSGIPLNPNGPLIQAGVPGLHDQPSSIYYPGSGVPSHGPPPSDLYYHSSDAPPNMVSVSEAEFQEIMERNKTVSSSAIARAVQDASSGNFGPAIETLVTAMSLIRQSKIANDDRCKILISSLQDTLKGIEDKSYSQRSHHHSRSGSPRDSRKKHRHRSRSPRERNEYRRSQDNDGKYNREHRRH